MDPLHKSITVKCPPAAAYEFFTNGLSSWWPMHSHSVFGPEAVMCSLEARAGGRITERNGHGGEALWGTVLIADPHRRLVFTWHPGRAPATAQLVCITFLATDGGTRVDLEHGDWHCLGQAAQEQREAYDSGWDVVLGQHFAQTANR